MAYLTSFQTTGSTGDGPRVDFGDTTNKNLYMEIGAYDNINNIDTKNRQLKIFGNQGIPIQVLLVNLPKACTAPADAEFGSIVINKKTGQLYVL